MPALTTHCLYGDKIALNSTSDYLLKIINGNKQIFHIGCQGPDLLFFYHKIPYLQSNGRDINKLGSDLHVKNINKLFASLLKSAYTNKDEQSIAYVCGFIAHYCLDSQCHPYIYYRTGSTNRDTGHCHVAFEGMIDGGLLDHFKLKRDQYRNDKLIQHNKKQRKVVTKILTKALNDALDKNISEKIIDCCCKDMITIEKILYDPKGKKYASFGKIEKKIHADGLATSMLIPIDYDDKIDCLNYRKDKWYHPCDKNIESNEDFLQIAQKAVDLGKTIYLCFDKYLHDQASLDDVLKLINNRSFETNYPTLVEMKYFALDE